MLMLVPTYRVLVEATWILSAHPAPLGRADGQVRPAPPLRIRATPGL